MTPLDVGIMGASYPPVQESLERNEVVREAHTWLRTPYHHQGRIKGAGVDCATLLCEVYEACGIIDHVDPRPYTPDWHLHRSEEVYLRWLNKFAIEIKDNPQHGDVAVWKFGRCFSHAAIIIGNGQIIHAYIGTPVSLASMSEEVFRDREVKYFTPWNK